MLKKHLKKIVSLVLVTMMAIGMSITAIAAEPYQNELEAVMDTSLADSGQVTHYDTMFTIFARLHTAEVMRIAI